MLLLVLGLVLFLGVHSTRIVAEGWRTGMVARMGETPWKAVYSLLSIAGFVLIVWGYGLARQSPVVLWAPLPAGVRHLSSLLTLVAFVLLVAAYVPRNHLKARLKHPMIIGVKLWAFGHLIANNTLADLVLFGAFLVWAVLDFRSARKRPLLSPPAAAQAAMTAITVVVGVAAWAAFAFWLHARWIGVSPMGV
jgi:uncharacterized membrane protein